MNLMFTTTLSPIPPNPSAVAEFPIYWGGYYSLYYPYRFYDLASGCFYTGLTADDVGGLRYQLAADNVNFEQSLPDVRIPSPRRKGTWRPGIEKIAFVRQPTDLHHRFRSLRYRYTDFYLKNNVLASEAAERDVRQPDFLFCAADTGENSQDTPLVLRTGTGNWLNLAAANGNTNGEGPGIIRPPIKITFHKLGPCIVTGAQGGPYSYNYGWGSFNDPNQIPVLYPVITSSNSSEFTIRLRFWIQDGSGGSSQATNGTWHLPISIGGQASLQISTNQTDWQTVATATNTGSVTEWYHDGNTNSPTYFRAVPQ